MYVACPGNGLRRSFPCVGSIDQERHRHTLDCRRLLVGPKFKKSPAKSGARSEVWTSVGHSRFPTNPTLIFAGSQQRDPAGVEAKRRSWAVSV